MADTDRFAQVVAGALNRTKAGLDAHDSRRKAYDTAYQTYRASAPRQPGIDPWRSQLRVKYGKQVIDTELVNIVSGKPRAKVLPRHPDDEQAARAMQYVLDYYVSEDHMVEKQPVFVQQALIYGPTVAKNHWLYLKGRKPVRNFMLDPSGQTVVEGEVAEQDIVLRDGPTFEPWDIYDAWWDPDGRDVDDSDYVVLRSWVSKDYLLRNAYNPDTGTGLYHNVDVLLASGPGARRDSSAQETFLRSQQTKRKDKIELWEVWRDDELIVIGNRQVLLRHQPNPFWHKKKPIVIAQAMPDVFEMQGISETEVIDHIQQALWTLQNLTFDQLHMSAMRGITYRESGVINPDALELKPRFKWPVADHDDIKVVDFPPVGNDVFVERERLKGDLQLVSGVNPYVSGSDLGTVDQNTATGVTALQEVASRLLRFKAGMIQYKGYQRTFEQWSEMVKQFLDHDVQVRIVGPGDTVDWRRYGPQDVIGSYDIVLEGTEESLSKQQARGEAIALLNAFAPLVPTGMVNINPLLEKVAAAYDFPNPQALLAQPQQPIQAAPFGQVPMASQNGAPQQLMGGRPLGLAAGNAIQQGR